MTRIAFHTGWTVRPKTSIFAQLGGQGDAPQPVTLPHDALISSDRSATERGKNAYFTSSAAFEYENRFAVPSEWADKRITLELDGAYRDAMVFVNGAFVGQRPYGYSLFTLPLDDFLRYGDENTVRVEVRAHDDSRWYTGAGITRSATLLVDELVHTTPIGVRISTSDVDAERAVVEVALDISNAALGARTVTAEAELVDSSGATVATVSAPITIRAGATSTARLRAYVREPERWSVDVPTLYTARTRLSDEAGAFEERSTSFGIRTLQLDPFKGLQINGHPVKLRGACIHHDNGPLGAAAFSRAEERRVEILKAAGFNAIRSAHNPISTALLDACDRLGMLVMDETFDVWTESKSSFDYSLSFPEWWERDVESMVAKDFNHPSVIMYSIGNENPETGSPLGSILGRDLAEKVRDLDPTRFVTNAVNGFVSVISDVFASMQQQGPAAAGGVNDAMASAGDMMNRVSASPLVSEKTAESLSVLDVVGLNYGDARYELDREAFPSRVIVGSETFPSHIDVLWDLVTRNPHVIGDFTWTGWDYLGEVGIGRLRYKDEPPAFEAPYPWRTAWCGDIDITGHRRTMSYYRETVFGLRREPYIAVHRPQLHGRATVEGGWSWTDSLSSWSWAVDDGVPITVDVYTDADEVELLVDDEPISRQRVGEDRAFQARFETVYQPGRLTAVGYRNGLETGRTELRSASADARLVATADRSTLSSGPGDLSFVTVELRDASGVLLTDADRLVSVDVDGAAVLHAFASARPDTEEPFGASACRTFDGRALAIVRPTGEGVARVRVTSEGLAPVELDIRVGARLGEAAQIGV